jgi:hypothetical protein
MTAMADTTTTTPTAATATKSARRRRRVIAPDAIPDGVLAWTGKIPKRSALHLWRRGVCRRFATSARILRVAWALEWLFADCGYAYPTDSFLARQTDLPVNKVQAALAELESAGAIIRASVVWGGSLRRRIWPAVAVSDGVSIPPTVGGIDTPHRGTKIPPTVGGHNLKLKALTSETITAARLDAERRERRSAR